MPRSPSSHSHPLPTRDTIPIQSADNDAHLDTLAQRIDHIFRLNENGTKKENDWKKLLVAFDGLRVSDQAYVLQQIASDSRKHLIQDARNLDQDILSHVAPEIRDPLIDVLNPAQLDKMLRVIESSQVVDILSSIEDTEKRGRLLASLSLRQRRVVEKYLAYPEHSVGRLMRQNYMAMPIEWTVGQAIDVFRSAKIKAISQDFYALILTDERNRPVGIVHVSLILRNQRTVQLRTLCEDDPVSVRADTDQEDAANTFRRYGLIEAPVVDDSGELIGTISVQEIFDVIEEEQEDDLLNLSGVMTDDFYQDVFSTARARIAWLLVNLATAIVASWVISQFSDQMSRLITLAILMPIVASMGGNAGTQTLAIAVRALATNQLTSTNTMRVLIKEGVVGLGNGALLGVLMAGLTFLWFGPGLLPWIMAVAMVINSVTAGVLGLLIPVALDRLGWDPAVGSSIVLTTFTDCIGFLAFLGLAALFL